MPEKVYNKGDVIICEGDWGESILQITAGSVEVISGYGSADENKLTELTAGKYFGEMAVLEGYPRSATVVASEDGTVIDEIPGKQIDQYLTEHPEKVLGLFCHLSDRLRDLTDDYEEAAHTLEKIEQGEKPRNESFFARISKGISSLFGGDKDEISAETLRYIESADYTKGYSKDVVSYEPGTVIFREGEPGRCMYAIHWGRVGIYTAYGTPDEKKLTELMANQFFGEMGMIEGKPRSATAVALDENTTLEIITSDDLAELFSENPSKVCMILQNLSYRIRRLSREYDAVCKKIRACS